MEENNKQVVEMTAEEKAQFEAFKEEKAKKEAEARAKAERELYKTLVDDEVEAAIPNLLCLSEGIKETKETVYGNFREILRMKGELFGLAPDAQRSHTFTNSAGDKRLRLGVCVTDDYRDTVEDGVEIVKEYISSLANSAETQALVNMVFKLLARDAKGTLKASRIVQLRRIADDIGYERFLEGVKIIEESYQPAISKQYVRAEIKNEKGQWVSIPLGMTEA